MITDANGMGADFARDRPELSEKVGLKVIETLESRLGRKPAEGEIEAKGSQMVHPNGNVTFCWEDQAFLRLVFGQGKVTILEV
jgi:hypothetical protein